MDSNRPVFMKNRLIASSTAPNWLDLSIQQYKFLFNTPMLISFQLQECRCTGHIGCRRHRPRLSNNRTSTNIRTTNCPPATKRGARLEARPRRHRARLSAQRRHQRTTTRHTTASRVRETARHRRRQRRRHRRHSSPSRSSRRRTTTWVTTRATPRARPRPTTIRK